MGAVVPAAVPVAVAALAAGLAVSLWVPLQRRAGRARRGRLFLPLAVLVGGLVPAERLVLVAIGVAVAAGAWLLWRARGRRRQAHLRASGVVEACEQLAAELASGLPPGLALERVAGASALWRPVAEAHRIGADVPGALRRAAATPGAEALRWVAAAWQVAHRTGQGLADALDAVALDLRAAASTRAVVAGELASARATARLMAALPVIALLMGSGMGGDPWAFLLSTPPGLACLAGGLAAGGAGLWWIERIADAVERA